MENVMNEKKNGTLSLHELYARLASSVDKVIAGDMDVQRANAVVALCSSATKIASLLVNYHRLKADSQPAIMIPMLESPTDLLLESLPQETSTKKKVNIETAKAGGSRFTEDDFRGPRRI
jgi:hypothetical protein